VTSPAESAIGLRFATFQDSVTQIAYGIARARTFPMRYAIYFTPAPTDPITRLAAGWLGRDAFTGSVLEPQTAGPLHAAEIAFHAAPARRYGFHATLKAPFLLAAGQSEAALESALADFAAEAAPVEIPKLILHQMDGFFALVPERPVAALNLLANEIVSEFDRFRAPITEVEIERRNPDQLSPAQFRYLCQWGYPYVFEAFRFHMTLTGRVGREDSPRVRAALEELFAGVIGRPLGVDSLALFVEPEAGAPFVVRSRHGFGRRLDRKIA
jgi:putative phosphonate metabolism protein